MAYYYGSLCGLFQMKTFTPYSVGTFLVYSDRDSNGSVLCAVEKILKDRQQQNSQMSFHTMIDGYPFPKVFKKENFYLMKNLRLRPGDVLLSVYPKCGTNWVSYITWSILHPNEETPAGSRILSMEIPLVESYGLGKWTESSEDQARTLCTHLPSRLLSVQDRAKYVVVVRNPFDCCVSYYHFAQNVPLTNIPADGKNIPNFFFEYFLSGEISFGDYFDHLLEWYERRNDANVHFMTFEELKEDPKTEIMKLARFLGREKEMEADGGRLLEKIVHQSSFSFMSKNVPYNIKCGEYAPGLLPILRKGQVGSFRDELTEEQIRRLKEKMESCLQGTTLLELWKDL